MCSELPNVMGVTRISGIPPHCHVLDRVGSAPPLFWFPAWYGLTNYKYLASSTPDVNGVSIIKPRHHVWIFAVQPTLN